jgi:hypothetical protein
MRLIWARLVARLAIFALASTFTTAAFAGTEEDKTQARQLATDGVKAFDAGDWARAVSYFEAAEKLFHAPTHLLYIARGQAKLGKLVAARDSYRKIESEPLGPTASPAFKKAQVDAGEERQQLEQRIPTLVVRVEPRDVEGLEVLIDGRVIEGSELGGALVDPGRHRVEARAPGRTAPPVEIEVVLGEKRDVVVDFSGSPAPEKQADAPPQATVAPQDDGATMTILGVSAVGLGVAGIGVGAVLGIVSMGKSSDADELYEACKQKSCAQNSTEAVEVRGLDDEAATFGTISVLSLGLGAAFAATGVVILVVGSDDGGASEARVEVRPALGGGFVSGTF